MLHATSLFLQPPENIRKSGGIVGDKLHDMGLTYLPFTCCTVLIFPLVTYLRMYSTLSLLLTDALLKLYSRTPSCLSIFLADSVYNKSLKIFVFNSIHANVPFLYPLKTVNFCFLIFECV